MSLPPEDKPVVPAPAAAIAHEVELELPAEVDLNVDPVGDTTPPQAKNYELSAPVVRDATDDELKVFGDIMVPILPDAMSAVNDDMDAGRLGEVDVSEQSVNWYTNLLAGFKSHPAAGVFEDALADPNADWRNTLVHNDQPINIGRPKFNNKGRGAGMSSERLQMSIRSRLGLGSPVQVPMMASGFYVTHKPLGEDEIINMWRKVIADPIRLGRATHGLLFSNNQVFANKAIYEAWSANIVDTTVKDLPRANIVDHLTVNDIPLIAHSVATAVYPNGFPLTRAVFTEDTKMPKGEIKQIIDVRKALFMNSKAFTENQKAHMVKRIEQPMTLAQVKEYRDQFVFNHNTVIDIDDSIKLHLHTPSLREYFDSGEKWINEIQAAVHSALGEDADEAARMPYISHLAKATRLRQYAHYVKSIEEDGELYTTRENVDQVLTSLSASDEITKKVYKAISDYINHSQVALIATTSVNVYEDKMSGNKWPRLIPIDAVSVFFQLVEQKLRGIVSRNLEGTSA